MSVPFWVLLIVTGTCEAMAGALLAYDLSGPGIALLTFGILVGFLTIRCVAGQASMDAAHGWAKVRAEIDRARRQGFGSVAVVRIPLNAPRQAVRSPGWERAESLLRGSDSMWIEARALFLLLPGADTDTAFQPIDRVVAHISDLAPAPPLVAAFPDEVLTLGALIDQLHAVPRPSRRSAPALPAPRIPEQHVPVSLVSEAHRQESA